MDKTEKMMYDSTEKMDLAKQQTQQNVECPKKIFIIHLLCAEPL